MGRVQGTTWDSAGTCLKEQETAYRAGLEDKGREPGKTVRERCVYQDRRQGAFRDTLHARTPNAEVGHGAGAGSSGELPKAPTSECRWIPGPAEWRSWTASSNPKAELRAKKEQSQGTEDSGSCWPEAGRPGRVPASGMNDGAYCHQPLATVQACDVSHNVFAAPDPGPVSLRSKLLPPLPARELVPSHWTLRCPHRLRWVTLPRANAAGRRCSAEVPSGGPSTSWQVDAPT